MIRQKWLAAAAAAALAFTMASCASDRDDDSSSSDSGASQDSGSDSDDASDDADDSDAGDAGDDAGDSDAGDSDAGDAGGDTDGVLVFGAAGAPEMFDPTYATDGETFRISNQILEGLVGFEPGTAKVAPMLATSWDHSEDGLVWTFNLQDGVTFSDGEPWNAEAACFNLDRMYGQTGAGAVQSEYWQDNFGGFKDEVDADGNPVPSVYASCDATSDNTIDVNLTRYTSKFPAILGLPSFFMHSPKALVEYDADNVQTEGDSFVFPAYALEHPTGTGPFVLSKYDQANGTITLDRRDDYWGDNAKLSQLIFQIIPDETARKQALEAGTIDAYDFPNPGDWSDLQDKGFDLEVRPAFNVLYMGMTLKNNEKLQDVNVRKAIAHALNRQQFVDTQLPEGAEVAKEFYPDTVMGWTPDVEEYQYDPELAKQMLADAGASDLTVEFWWPTEVTRPYMPDPKAVFTALSADLEAVGITVNATSKPWTGGYLDGVSAHQADLFLLGWTGDYDAPDNFLAAFFGNPEGDFYTAGGGFGKDLSAALEAADTIPDADERAAAYVEINKKIMGEWLPGVPISHSPPAMVVASDVHGLVPSPLTAELFKTITIG